MALSSAFCHSLALLCAVLVVTPTCVQAQSNNNPTVANDNSCPEGFWGEDCENECHCLNQYVCSSEGICLDYQCARGWDRAPDCDEPCAENLFGVNCALTCHCPDEEGIRCDSVNGWCLPNFICHQEWTGPSCQLRRPRLTNPPEVFDITCTELSLRWRQWSSDRDIGDPPIASYTVEYSTNGGTSWSFFSSQDHEEGSTRTYELTMTPLTPDIDYQFRVWVNRRDYDKVEPGLPSLPSRAVRADCEVETTAGPIPTTTRRTTTVEDVITTEPGQPTTEPPPTTTPDQASSPRVTTSFFPMPSSSFSSSATSGSTPVVTASPVQEALSSTGAQVMPTSSEGGAGSWTSVTTWPPWIRTRTPSALTSEFTPRQDTTVPMSPQSSTSDPNSPETSPQNSDSSTESTSELSTVESRGTTTEFMVPSTTWPVVLPSSASTHASRGSTVSEDFGSTTLSSVDLSSIGVTRPQTTWPWDIPTVSTAPRSTAISDATSQQTNMYTSTAVSTESVTTDSLTPSGITTVAMMTSEMTTLSLGETSSSLAHQSTDITPVTPPPVSSTTMSFPATRGTEPSTVTGYPSDGGQTSTPAGDTPSEVGDVTVSEEAQTGRVFVHWSAPTTSGPISNYVITYRKMATGDCDFSTLGSPITILVDDSDRTYELSNLEPWALYQVSVSALNSGGIGPETSKMVLSPEIEPSGTVTNLAASSQSDRAIVVTWDPVTCAERGGTLVQYDVVLRLVDSGVQIGDVLSTRNETLTLENLVPYTQYAVNVRFVNNAGPGPYSRDAQVRTLQNAPSPVRNITVSMTESGGVYVHWNEPADLSGPLSAYDLAYQQVGIGDCPGEVLGGLRTQQYPASSTSVSLTGLLPWTRYRIEVNAVNSAGRSTQATTFTTFETIPTGAVSNLLHEQLETTIELIWDPVPCELRGGSLNYYEVRFTVNGNTIVRNNQTLQEMIRITGLTPATSYGVTIYFHNHVGRGPASAVLRVNTTIDRPPPPSLDTIQVHNLTPSSFTVSWANPAPVTGGIVGYNVRYKSDGVTWFQQEVNNALSLLVTDLEPFTEYQIEINAINAVGPGGFSAPVFARTLEGVPSNPRDFVVTRTSQNCIYLAWSPPPATQGPLMSYKISYRVTEIHSSSNANPSTVDIEVPDGSITSYDLCDLLPAALYVVYVSAATSSQIYGDTAMVQSFTTMAPPTAPPAPTVLTSTRTTITVALEPAVLTGGPVSGYFIVVHAVGDARKKRSLMEKVVHTFLLDNLVQEFQHGANTYRSRTKRQSQIRPTTFLGLDGDTAAFIISSQILQPTEFIVGDNRTFSGYWNHPLRPETTYNITYVVVSSLDGITMMNYASIAEPHKTSGPGVPAVDEGNDLLLIILLAVLGGILLILVIIVVICCCCCRGQPSDKDSEKPIKSNTLKATWLDYYTNNFGTLQKEKNHIWSDINTLEQPRHLTIYDDKTYMPDDLKVSVIQDGHPKLSFDQEYSNLPQGKTHASLVAERPENAERNRFPHILAYDHARVMLKGRKNDYINANYINGYSQRVQYIAAQSPFNDTTVADFWYMVYQERATQVVFLARLQEDEIMKSVRYWPDDQGSKQFGPILVRHIGTDSFSNFEVRAFDLSKQGSPSLRRVTQYQLTAWPDHGIPDDPIPFLDFRMKVKTDLPEDAGAPTIVHCGTGVSRSAVYIAVDCLLEQAKIENCVNVFKYVYKMRRNRPLMVRTLKQYVFIYEILFEALITNYNIVGDDLKVNYRLLSNVNPLNSKSYFRQQFEMMEEYIPSLPPQLCQVALREQNKEKNRFSTIVPLDKLRVPLVTPGGMGRTDYINALFVDGYLRKGEFIVTQTPLQSTVIDFWKMIYDHGVNTVVMLNNSDFKEDTCAQYWPSRKGMEKHDLFFVNLVDVVEKEHMTIRTVMLSSGQRPKEEPREVRLFQYESWKMYEKVPWSRESFIQLMEAVETWREDSDSTGIPAVIHCMDGASQSGLYCACAVLCEKMSLEGEVDVFHTVKHMKRTRPHFVNTLDQYKFCFKVLWDYMNTRIKGFQKRPYNYSDPEFADTGQSVA